MSLLADLLSKIKHKEQQGAIPPNLAQIVQRASGKQKAATRIKIALLAALLLVACGFGTIYFANRYLKSVSPTLMANRVQEQGNIQTDHVAVIAEKVSAAKTATVVQSATAVQQPGVGPVKKLKEEKAALNSSPVPEEIPKQENNKPFLPTDIVRNRQQRDNAVSTTAGPVRKAPQSGKSGNVPGLDKTSADEKDVALYTARSYEQNSNYTQAIRHYKKALEKDPGNYLIMNNLANILIRTGSFKEAIQYSMDALAAHRNYVPSLVNLGVANIQLGNMMEGEVHLLKAASIEPSNKTVLFNLGLLYEKTSKYGESLTAFQKLADSKDPGGYLGVARVLEKQGNRVEAEKRYKEILSMDNIDPVTRQLVNERLQVIGNR